MGDFNVSRQGASDGAIDLNVRGGIQPYSVLWSNGNQHEELRDVPAGTYGYTITDNVGTVKTGSVVLTSPGPLNAMVTIISVCP